MNKRTIKGIISENFGFAVSKICLLECSSNDYLKIDYILFSVCGIDYRVYYNDYKKRYMIEFYQE